MATPTSLTYLVYLCTLSVGKTVLYISYLLKVYTTCYIIVPQLLKDICISAFSKTES